ncbi:MAG TPA: hypothetical protein VIG48_12020 [Jatrophihabitans sp.]
MSGYDDDGRDMTRGFDSDTIDTGGGNSGAGSGAAVAQFIDELRGLGDQEPPAPSPELAAVLAGTALPSRGRRPARGRVVAAVVACAVLGGTGIAAAKGRLPQPAQRVVSDVVDSVTPFTVPSRPEPNPPERTTPEQPVRRPVVGPPVGRHSDDGQVGNGARSPEHESPGNEAPDPAPENSSASGAGQPEGNDAGAPEGGGGDGGSGD